jgi:putative salt-induced outer membrane protein YdiY
MNRTIQTLGCLSAALYLGQFSAGAQAPGVPEKTKWETVASAGLTVQSGNTESLAANFGLDTKRKWIKDEALLGISVGYGKSSSPGNERSRTTDQAKAYGQYNHLVSDRAFFGLRVEGEHDGIADLAYRIRIAPLVGYYLVKTEKTSLSFDIGPAAVIERYEETTTNPTPTTDTYLSIRFSERFERKISDTTKIWQTAEYLPSVKEWQEKYLINAEIGISTAINPKWDLQAKLQINHDSQPAGNKEYTDTRLIAGTAYKF